MGAGTHYRRSKKRKSVESLVGCSFGRVTRGKIEECEKQNMQQMRVRGGDAILTAVDYSVIVLL